MEELKNTALCFLPFLFIVRHGVCAFGLYHFLPVSDMFHSNLLRYFCSYASREVRELGLDGRDCSHNIPGLVGRSRSMSYGILTCQRGYI